MDCTQCNQAIRDGESVWRPGRDSMAHNDCLAAALARAETAEAEVARLTAERDTLRAQLEEAQGWRPVDDAPERHQVCAIVVRGLPYGFEMGKPAFVIESSSGRLIDIPADYVIGWRPAPPQE